MTTKIDGAVVFVTGANGGLGEEFVRQSLQRGAVKVYATARSPREWGDPRIAPLFLDVTDPESVAQAVKNAADTTIVINNAGMTRRGPLAEARMTDVRAIFETNFFGALNVAQAFAPILEFNRNGALLNVLSVLSWLGSGNAYSASKAALWSATNSLRLELAPRGILVSGLHLGFTATPMTKGIDAPMNNAADVVRAALNGLEEGDYEILADDLSVTTKANLAAPIEVMYPQLVKP
ncbi:SDR family oxidoreductase [Arthrobacter ramosus]|uniref:SDR family oxidoreductase n=1 Tax=Arthrobacter ramosus TaxID=1672 RepID=A0ABV5Y4N6_ARTRM|nr:SDR family oxidoreductase [Arthrobacter ramosus]